TQSSPEIHPAKAKRSLIKRGVGVAQTQPKPDLSALTVKQLQEIVGNRSSRYRKADLIRMAHTFA
ncbi:hypothetical protein OAK87_01445, partial [bacterium]|nr:hypothetical protein [bacterium]